MKKIMIWFSAIILTGCASLERGCSDFGADNFGADWIVVQYDFNMKPANCWTVRGQSITNEKGSDGIYWVSNSGNLIHLSGWYNRVQVTGEWNIAAKELGIRLDKCTEGKYNEDENENR